jgi:ribosomal protein S18 acetylase RimI-like enzyme
VSVRIRPYASADLERGRALFAELVQRHRDIYEDPGIGGDDPGAHFDEHLRTPSLVAAWVAETEDGVVAFTSLLLEGDEGQLEPVIVARGVRSQGIGAKLVEHAVADARARGVRFLSVKPVARNVEAIAFFHRAGFRTLGHVDLFMDLVPNSKRGWRPGVTLHGKPLRY